VKLSHFFLPHPDTHKKAHLISISGFLTYIFLFITLQFLFSFISFTKPGVLGVSSNITVSEIIRLTNIERQKNNLPPLSENTKLDDAARRKAGNMFEENYWAHYSPSGKDPWGFINASGYKFSYAGENLARNFTNSSDVVQAWMNSPSHRDNLLNPNYQEIGVEVVEGTLLGQKTTLVVQEFGKPVQAIAVLPNTEEAVQQVQSIDTSSPAPSEAGPAALIAQENPSTQVQPSPVVAGQKETKASFLINPTQITKNLGFLIIGLVLILTLIDIYLIRKRGVLRISTRHLPQISLMIVLFMILLNLVVGRIL
jgi:hypothetical protein